jgi:hypothetical protein
MCSFHKPVNSTFPYGFLIGVSLGVLWNESIAGCKTYHPNATMAIFRDKDSYDLSFALQKATNTSYASWIAAKQTNYSQGASLNWFWSDGVPLEGNVNNTRYIKWSTAKPAIYNLETCAFMYSNYGDIGNMPCDYRFVATCEVHGEKSAGGANYIY